MRDLGIGTEVVFGRGSQGKSDSVNSVLDRGQGNVYLRPVNRVGQQVKDPGKEVGADHTQLPRNSVNFGSTGHHRRVSPVAN